MTPFEQGEIEAVARNLDALSLRSSAARLRALVGTPADPERICPVQDRSKRRPKAIPWGLAEILYPAYGHAQTLEQLSTRGGFGWRELGNLAADDYTPDRPRLVRPPLLDLYEMAMARR
jgi:hypothetical protein